MLYNRSRMKMLVFAVVLLALLTPRAFASAGSDSNSATAAQPSGSTQTVRVSELPPISMSKDWSDWSYWLFTFFLLTTSALQVYLLWGNLRAIERQALTMERQTTVLEKSVELAEKSADTAKQNLEMFVSRERSHLRVELAPVEYPLQPGAVKLRYTVRLHGATEAYISSSCARAELTDSAEPAEDKHWWPAMSIPQVITPENRVVEGQVQGVFPRMVLTRTTSPQSMQARSLFISGASSSTTTFLG